MAEVTITIGGRGHAVACRDGEEDRLRQLGAMLDERWAVAARASGGNPAQAASRPISIRHKLVDDEERQQMSESFTYMCQDGGQKLIKSKSQQMLDRFCAGNSPPSIAASYSLALASRQQQQQRLAPAGANSSFLLSSQSSSRSSSSILQARGFWTSGNQDASNQHQFGHSSSGSLGLSSGNGSFNSTASCSFEINQLNGSNSNKKIPSPIINDAFEGLMTNDDDL